MFSADHSVITVEKSVKPSSKVTVKLTAHDSGSNKLATGGEKIWIKVTNECTKDASGSCIPVEGATPTLSAPKVGLMTDKTDGTYTFEFETEAKEGKITVSIYQLGPFTTVKEVVYKSTDWTGTPYTRNTQSDLALNSPAATSITGATSGPISSIAYLNYFAGTSGNYPIFSFVVTG